MLLYSTAALLAGFLLDLLLGDPQGFPHLVRGMGAWIAYLEKRLYPIPNRQLGGALLVVLTLLVFTTAPALLLLGAWRLSPVLYFVLEALLCWQCIAFKDLKAESLCVYAALACGDLPAARRAVAKIVGRDTECLDTAGVTRAAVETIAENASDGVVAPLFYMMLGGGPLGCVYKAINTMDSMIGYQNERYHAFGRCAAKLDDAVNYLPARLCALLMLAITRACGLDAGNAKRIYLRDKRKHASPNSAQTEAVMAGALGVRLAGDAFYGGTLMKKQSIGDALHPVAPSDILRAHRLLAGASWLMLAFALLWRGLRYAAL